MNFINHHFLTHYHITRNIVFLRYKIKKIFISSQVLRNWKLFRFKNILLTLKIWVLIIQIYIQQIRKRNWFSFCWTCITHMSIRFFLNHHIRRCNCMIKGATEHEAIIISWSQNISINWTLLNFELQSTRLIYKRRSTQNGRMESCSGSLSL